MKYLKYTRLLCMALLAMGFTACNDEDAYFEEDAQNSPIVVNKVYLQDVESSVPDREVTFARLGQVIRLSGSGLYGVRKVYINGYDTYFNRALVSDQSLLVQLNKETPVAEAEEEVRNTIRLVKDGSEFVYKDLVVRAASPQISHISNTLPLEGEKVIVYGANLQETLKLILPGGVEVSAGIESDEDGEWYSFTMPGGVSQGGSITSEGANGTAVTPAYFTEKSCMILDFDGTGVQGFWSWDAGKSMCDDEHDVADDPLGKRGKCALLVPQRMLDAGGAVSGKPRVSEWWTAGNDEPTDDWNRMTGLIPAETPVNEVAFQFDIYVPQPWSGTGHIQISLMNNFNISGIGSDDDGTNNTVAFCVPWIKEGVVVPFYTEGWQTVTIPFSQFNKYATLLENEEEATFQMVIDDRNGASYRNFGMGFVNTDFTFGGVTVESTLFNQKIYVDNWRVVPCKKTIVSDFPDEEE